MSKLTNQRLPAKADGLEVQILDQTRFGLSLSCVDKSPTIQLMSAHFYSQFDHRTATVAVISMFMLIANTLRKTRRAFGIQCWGFDLCDEEDAKEEAS
ncbi:hypothetical protein K2173_025362 [Erythroxylum novogranatense]|uniref:Uncharacterized protein n=1 Tax=Erythroxylum novogranatense TaxID=1862640 RepID=A0AAV8UDJ5_9ROSI|nr:hypothetical protein K2173_025362 [Erythroxylum novogranatense]